MDNVLVLCPHTDDEINCAGAIAKHIESGDMVRVIAFSTGNQETGACASEFMKSMHKLGVADYLLLSFITRYMYTDRQDILQILCDEKKPDIVYCPTTWDIHQDHQVVVQEAQRAFRYCTIYGYEIARNSITDNQVNHYVVLQERHIELKNDLAQCYQSQQFRTYMDLDYFKAVGRFRGSQISVEYAESFQTIRRIEK